MLHPATHQGEDKTLAITVKNTGFLLERLGQDCHPLQFLRELTRNAIEGIARTGEAGEVIWDVDWNLFDLEGVYKLCVIDTGIGMTADEMKEYINALSSSFAEQSLTGNYGVGAKISAAPRNPAGILYLSWKESHGSMVHFWRQPENGTYGLRQFKRDDGTYGTSLDLSDDIKPGQIGQHGTMVVLMGKSDQENTVQAPEGVPSASRWVAKYLNTRFFEFPESITVKAREGWENPRTDSKRNKLRTITGQKKYLVDHAESFGKVSLSGATAHWWILEDSPALDQESNYFASSGHIAALYQNELYEMVLSRAGTAKLQQFGVIFGCRRVVIYMEPHAALQAQITTNTARTNLLINNQPLPWEDWAVEFREKMPPEIDELIRKTAAASESSDHSQTIRERLKGILDLYKVSRYRPDPTGTVNIDIDSTIQGGQPSVNQLSKSASRKSPASGNAGGAAGSVYAAFEKKDGVPGNRVEPEIFPKVKWITLADGTREPGTLEDRAARYIKNQNLILINGDFRIFVDMIKRWCDEYREIPAAGETIRDIVRAWFEQALVESVMGVLALQRSKEWSDEDIEVALSEEALTAAVAQRYHVNNCVKRELGSKLGRSGQPLERSRSNGEAVLSTAE